MHTGRQLTWLHKLTLGLLLGIGFPVLLFVVTELSLRLFGVGTEPCFLRESADVSGKMVWRENRDCTQHIFGAALARKPLPLQVAKDKSPGSFRVVILGSSAAMGDPEPAFSVARMLEVMLEVRHPEQRIEVINAAITAINSHVVRDIAKDCMALSPDLLVVYEGNNEIIGPFGPSGVLTPFLGNNTALGLLRESRKLRLIQWLQTLRVKDPSKTPKEWGGMAMFTKQAIQHSDPRLTLAEAYFGANLEDIITTASKGGADSILCTVAVNTRDFGPFRSDPNCTDPNENAEALYKRGRELLAQKRHQEARELLKRALDRDTLRFRTDSRFNNRIRSVAQEHAARTRLLDFEACLEAQSEDQLIGNEFLYEHVHLNFRGTHELARALLPLVEQSLSTRGLTPAKAEPPDAVHLRQALAFSLHEQAMIQMALLARYKAPPFTGTLDNPQRIKTTEQLIAKANSLLVSPGALDSLRAVHLTAVKQRPSDSLLARNAGAMLVVRGQAKEALPLLRRAEETFPDDIDTLMPLGLALQAAGRLQEADTIFARARLLEPRYPGLPPPSVQEIQGD